MASRLSFLPEHADLFVFGEFLRRVPRCFQTLDFAFDGFAFFVEHTPLRFTHQADFVAVFGQAHVGVVFPELQAVFGAAGEHAVGFVHAFGDEVVHQYAEIGLFAAQQERVLFADVLHGICACEQALCGGFFVAGGAVDLSGEEEALDGFGFKAGFEVARVEVVVFDGVAGA